MLLSESLAGTEIQIKCAAVAVFGAVDWQMTRERLQTDVDHRNPPTEVDVTFLACLLRNALLGAAVTQIVHNAIRFVAKVCVMQDATQENIIFYQ